MRLLAMTLLVVVLSGCAARHVERPQVHVEGPHLRAMTYNVNFGGAGMDLAIAAIREADADLVCLQETTPHWEAAIRRELASLYPHMEFRHVGGAGGQAILSRFEFHELAYLEDTPGWFPAWIVNAKTPLGTVQVVNVHLRPPLAEGGSATPSAYFGTGSIRREEVRLISEKLDPHAPALIVGDFNEHESGKAVTWLRQRGFADALRQFDAHSNTWEWRASAITLRGRYDHVLYSSDLKCLDSRVLRRGRSDHFPVVAVLVAQPAAR